METKIIAWIGNPYNISYRLLILKGDPDLPRYQVSGHFDPDLALYCSGDAGLAAATAREEDPCFLLEGDRRSSWWPLPRCLGQGLPTRGVWRPRDSEPQADVVCVARALVMAVEIGRAHV